MHDVRDRLCHVDCEEASLEKGVPSFSLHDNAQHYAEMEADERYLDCYSNNIHDDRVRHCKQRKPRGLDLWPLVLGYYEFVAERNFLNDY